MVGKELRLPLSVLLVQVQSNFRTPVLSPYQPREFLWQSPKARPLPYRGITQLLPHQFPEIKFKADFSSLSAEDQIHQSVLETPISPLCQTSASQSQTCISSIERNTNIAPCTTDDGEGERASSAGAKVVLSWMVDVDSIFELLLIGLHLLGLLGVKPGLIWFGRGGVSLGRDDLILAESSYDGSKNISADPARKEDLTKTESALIHLEIKRLKPSENYFFHAQGKFMTYKQET
ncbi:hypothetical protein CR513_61061, partial [Mucuna pruriens]